MNMSSNNVIHLKGINLAIVAAKRKYVDVTTAAHVVFGRIWSNSTYCASTCTLCDIRLPTRS